MEYKTLIGMISVLSIGPCGLMLFWTIAHDFHDTDNWKWKELIIDYCIVPLTIFLSMFISYYILDEDADICLYIQTILTMMYLIILNPYNIEDVYRNR